MMDSKTSTGSIVRLFSDSSTTSLEDSKGMLQMQFQVQFIGDHTSPEQWRYLESGSNPTDEASKGMNAKEFMQKSPGFLVADRRSLASARLIRNSLFLCMNSSHTFS